MTQALVVLFMLLMTSPVWAATYWVSPSGSDSNNGCISSASPLTSTAKQTIQGGLSCLTSAGDILKVRDGSYTELINWNSGPGVAGNPVILEAEHARQAFWNVPSGQQAAINIQGHSYATVRGFVFDGTNGSNNLVNAGYTVLAVTGSDKLVNVGCINSSIPSTCATHIRFENNEFRQTAYGFALVNAVSSDITFSGNFLHHLCKVRNCNVLYAGAPNTVFENNLVEDIAGAISLWNESASTANNGLFRNNTFRRTGVYWSTQNGTVQCCVNNDCPGGSEGLTCSQRMPQGFFSHNGGIGISRGSGTQVYNNIFENNYTTAISSDNGGNNCLIANNTIYGNLGPPEDGDYAASISLNVTGHGASGCAIRNNIVYQPGVTNPPPIYDGGTGTIRSTNLCSSASTGCTILGNPVFVNGPSGNFHIAVSSSPVVGAGTNLNTTFNSDADGRARPPAGAPWTIGAYEFSTQAVADFRLQASSPLRNTALCLPDVLLDITGYVRGTACDMGAYETVTPGVVAKYLFSEGMGLTIDDATGNGNTATFAPTGGWTTGRIGPYAGSFDGTRYASIVGTPTMRPDTEFFIAAWFKATTTDAAGAQLAALPNDGGYLYLRADGRLACGIYNGTSYPQVSTVAAYLTDTWYFVSCSYLKGNGLYLRVNHTQVGFSSLNETISYALTGTGNMEIGRSSVDTGYVFRGSMDNITFGNVFLTDANDLLLYQEGFSQRRILSMVTR